MKLKLSTPNKVWISLFSAWIFILSGVASPFFGSPGAWQALKLKNLLKNKTDKLLNYQADIQKLQVQVSGLEQNKYLQEREVRKVLGYAAPDELVFDFSADR